MKNARQFTIAAAAIAIILSPIWLLGFWGQGEDEDGTVEIVEEAPVPNWASKLHTLTLNSEAFSCSVSHGGEWTLFFSPDPDGICRLASIQADVCRDFEVAP